MDRRRVLLVVAAVVAALGTVLVFLYVQGADNRAEAQFATQDVLVANTQIERGETVRQALDSGKLSREAVAEGQILPGALSEATDVADLVALTTIYPGEQIVPQKLGATAAGESPLTIPPGKIAVSVNLTDPARVAGFITPGSEVAIIYNGTDPAGQQFTRTLMTRATVLGVGSTTPVSVAAAADGQEAPAPAEQVPNTLLTLAVDQAQAQRILFAQGSGELTFALLTPEADLKADPGVTAENLFG